VKSLLVLVTRRMAICHQDVQSRLQWISQLNPKWLCGSSQVLQNQVLKGTPSIRSRAHPTHL
jgi:hypothetical protein